MLQYNAEKMKARFTILVIAACALYAQDSGSTALPSAAKPIRLAIAGLNHGHVSGFLRGAQRRAEVEIVGVWDPQPELLSKYAKSDNFAAAILYTDLAKMLDTVKPEAVATFTDTFGHAAVVEACAPRHITVMMEKPMAVDMKQAHAMQQAAAKYGVSVLVNYETTWYRNYQEIYNIMHDRKPAGPIRKMVAMDGHTGPKEIHVQPEFFAWLSDPVKNGAGALFDFGCYGANLMTWLMDNQKPLKVTALAQTNKPEIYPRVDDQATILLQYPGAQGIIQASWDWAFDRKDFEVYAQQDLSGDTAVGASAISFDHGNGLRVRLPGQAAEETVASPERKPEERDSIAYLTAVVRGKFKPYGPSSLENNMVVVEILDAARESVRTGKTITLAR
jgi:predicted dehydrogenase